MNTAYEGLPEFRAISDYEALENLLRMYPGGHVELTIEHRKGQLVHVISWYDKNGEFVDEFSAETMENAFREMKRIQ